MGRVSSAHHCTHHARYLLKFEHFLPSLPVPVVGEMPSAARFAAVGMVGRPLTHVVRDAFCEGDEGITGNLPQLLLKGTAAVMSWAFTQSHWRLCRS